MGSDDWQGTTTSKASLTRWAYDPTCYGMGHTTLALTPQGRSYRLGPWPGNPGSRTMAPWLGRATNDLRSSHLLPHCRHGATGRTKDDDEGHNRTMPHRTVGELPPCLECRHDRHYRITPCHSTTWEAGQWRPRLWHAWMYDDAKTGHDGLPAKFTRFSLPGLSTTRVGRTHLSICNLAPGLYIRVARAPF
jgi:hypothetical protein